MKHIPGTNGFSIDQYGNVYNPDGTLRKTYRNGNGYVTAAVKWEDGCWWTVPVSRLVAMTFLEKENAEQTEVNHIDSNLENNTLINLEWVTPKQNNIHSEIMRRGNQYPTLCAELGGIPTALYKNAHEAAELLSVTPADIWNAVKTEKPINGVRFFHRPFNGNIPKELHKSKGFFKGMSKISAKPIKMLNILNGEILEFSSLHAAAEHFGVVKSHIHQALPKGNVIRVFQKKYQVAYADEDFQLMTPEDKTKALGHGPKKVFAYDHVVKSFTIFRTAKDYYSHAGLSKKAVTKALAKNELKRIGSWTGLYCNEENIQRLKDFVSSPVLT